MLSNPVKRTLTLNSLLFLPKSWFLNLCGSRADIYRRFLNVSISFVCVRIKVKHLIVWRKSHIFSFNLSFGYFIWINELIDVVYSEFKLQMFRQVFPFVIFNIRNFNRMNVKLACVNHRISNSKYFSYKAKGSYCNSIDLLKLII